MITCVHSQTTITQRINRGLLMHSMLVTLQSQSLRDREISFMLKDWFEWHDLYKTEAKLQQRLQIVQEYISHSLRHLDSRTQERYCLL